MSFKSPSSLITPTSLKSLNLNRIPTRWGQESPLNCPVMGSVGPSCSQMCIWVGGAMLKDGEGCRKIRGVKALLRSGG